MLRDFAAQENRFFLLSKRKRPQRTHAPVANHLAGNVGCAFDIISCACGDVAEENFLSGASAHQNRERALEISLRVGVLVIDRELHGQAQGHAARDNGDLVQRIGAGSHGRHQRVPCLVICGIALFLFRKNHGSALYAHHHFVFGHLEIGHEHKLAVLARGPQRCFVHQIGQIGAGETRRTAGNYGQVHIL